ncbi:MAG: hypothetical protein ACPIOQ_73020, partial [Promethearchaeia archaeon]
VCMCVEPAHTAAAAAAPHPSPTVAPAPLAAAAAVIGGVVALLVASASGDALPRENGVAFGCSDGREEGRLSQTCLGENTVSVAWAASRRAGDRARIPTDEHGSLSSGQLVGCR